MRQALLAQLGTVRVWVDAMRSKAHVVKALAMLKGVPEKESAGATVRIAPIRAKRSKAKR